MLRRPIGPRQMPALREAYATITREAAASPRPESITEDEVFYGLLNTVVATLPMYFARGDFTKVLVDALQTTDGADLPGMVDALIESQSSGMVYLERAPKMGDEAGESADMMVVAWSFVEDIFLAEITGIDEDGDLVNAVGMLDCGGERRSDPAIISKDVQASASAVVVASLLAQGGIVETEDADMRPPAMKGKKRRPAKPGTPPVAVIDLRRSVAQGLADVAEAERTYQHRWIVRGHWRNQACGPGRAERRRTYIAPYVKGPEGAPLLQHDKVFRW